MSALTGKVAIVTGATRGIGRATALALAGAGAALIVTGRSTAERPHRLAPGTVDDVAAAARDAGAADVLPLGCDLAVENDVNAIADRCLERFGRCDILINNAAVSFLGGFLEVPVTRWRPILNVNLMAPAILAHRLLPGMLARGAGHILTISSGSAHDDTIVQLPYAITKLGLERFATGLAYQFGNKGIAANCILINGVVRTESVDMLNPELSAESDYTAEEMGAAVRWLVTQPTTFTGNVLSLDDLTQRGALPPDRHNSFARRQPA